MTAAALLLCCTTVGAATLYTIPAETLVAPDAATTHRLCCDILNTGSRTADVTVRIRTRDGALVQSFGPTSLAPEEGTSRCLTARASYCEFEVQGSGRDYRALAIYDAGGEYRISLPAR
jgi:hypothetical protein